VPDIPRQEVAIVTGASRGLGAALVEALGAPQRLVIGVARSENEAQVARMQARGFGFAYRRCDLADRAQTAGLTHWLSSVLRRQRAARRFLLINNAGVVEPVEPIETLPVDALVAALQVNLVAAMQLSAAFLAATDKFTGTRIIVNISSGAARHPVAGWASYCTGKAALDMFTRCIAEEQATHANPARVCSLAPGVLDTEMQEVLRAADFPSVDRFRSLHASGDLVAPADAARRIVTYLERDDFGSVVIDDLRRSSPPLT